MRPPALLTVLCALAAAAAEEPAPEPAPSALLGRDRADRDLSFPLEGGTLRLNFKPGGYLTVVCEGGARLAGGEGAPRIEPATRVGRARVACAPPAAGYRRLLARLGASLVPGGNLSLALPPAAEPLAAHHLAGLEPLHRLTLTAASPSAPPAAPRADLLRGAPALRALEVRGVPLSREALDAAPASLAALVAAEVRVPAAALARLTSLTATRPELEGDAPLLRSLSLTLRGAAPSWARFPALRALSLSEWREARPARWAHCAALESLTLTSARAEALPARWLAACGALRSLALQSCRVGAPPAALLEGAGGGALESLSLRYCGLRALPAGLLDAAPRLLRLDLVGNQLRELPSGLFARSARLQTLVLARNDFRDRAVYAEVGVLRDLTLLDLSLNRRLGDACSGDPLGRLDSGESPLRELRNLSALSLSYTRVSRVCRDWRERMPRLYKLQLNYTNITSLGFTDLQHKRDSATSQRSPPPSMELYRTPVAALEYSAEDEQRARTLPPARFAVHLSEPLRCDCRMFRAARALRAHPLHVDLRGALLCAGAAPLPLAAVPLDDMLCPSRGAPCPAPCACADHERGRLGAPAWRVRVSCERAGLRRLPPLPRRLDVDWDLRLAGNRIDDLDGLPGNLTILDLRNNSLGSVSPRAAVALRGASRVLLAGNPLRCGCALLGAAAALRDRGALEAGAACAGRALAVAAEEERARCAAEEEGAAGGALLVAGAAALGAALLAALAALSALASPARRARVKAALVAWGWLPRGAEPDDGRPYDAFVSFSERDEAVARRIAAELEAGARPLRLCLHSRDWTPGEYIGAQIAASVRNARRTLVLVSRHFLRSQWARAEFREAAAASARAAAPHLVLVFLEPPAALPLDRELRRFLETNTYIEANNPNFWKLLRRAMPAPRDPAPPARAPPPAEPQPAGAQQMPTSLPAVAPVPEEISDPADAGSPSPSPAPADARSPSPSPAPADARSPSPSPASAAVRSPPPSPAPSASRSPSSSDVSSCSSRSSCASVPPAPPAPLPWAAPATPTPTPA